MDLEFIQEQMVEGLLVGDDDTVALAIPHYAVCVAGELDDV